MMISLIGLIKWLPVFCDYDTFPKTYLEMGLKRIEGIFWGIPVMPHELILSERIIFAHVSLDVGGFN